MQAFFFHINSMLSACFTGLNKMITLTSEAAWYTWGKKKINIREKQRKLLRISLYALRIGLQCSTSIVLLHHIYISTEGNLYFLLCS